MAHKNKVIRSFNLPGESVCVDVFQRPDGSFGFEQYRRDPEDPRGWYSIGHYGAAIHDSFEGALVEAQSKIHWLGDLL